MDSGHEGNEAADTEVKKAAKGLTSDKQSLPCILRKALPKNPVALRQRHNDKLKQTWTTEWRSTKRRQGRKLMKTDESTPSTSFLKRISSDHLTRNSASLISQLLVSHIPLNAYLHRFKRVDSDLCPLPNLRPRPREMGTRTRSYKKASTVFTGNNLRRTGSRWRLWPTS